MPRFDDDANELYAASIQLRVTTVDVKEYTGWDIRVADERTELPIETKLEPCRPVGRRERPRD